MGEYPEFEREFKCNCAHVPKKPGEGEHLIDCPVRVAAALHDQERMKADFEEAARLLREGNVDDLVAFAGRDVGGRADAAFRRSWAAPSSTGGREPRFKHAGDAATSLEEG